MKVLQNSVIKVVVQKKIQQVFDLDKLLSLKNYKFANFNGFFNTFGER